MGVIPRSWGERRRVLEGLTSPVEMRDGMDIPTRGNGRNGGQFNGRSRVRGGQTMVAVTSGKGGVGKTNIAVNLAICLAGKGLRVTLVDVDVGLANADLLLNVNVPYNMSHFLSGQRDMNEITVPVGGGVQLIAGGSGMGGTCNLGDFDCQRAVSALRQVDTDWLVLDCGAGIGTGVVRFAGSADTVLVVTTPEPTALADAYATIKTLLREGYGGSIRLLVNMVDSRAEAKAAVDRIRRVAEKFLKYPIADAGYLLHDTHVELAVRQRQPFVLRYPKCSASACAAAVAARLANENTSSEVRGGLLRRVAGLFA